MFSLLSTSAAEVGTDMFLLLATEFGGGFLVEGVLPLDYDYYGLGQGFYFETSSGYFMLSAFASVDDREATGSRDFRDRGFAGGVDFCFFVSPLFSFGSGVVVRTVPLSAYRWETGVPFFVQFRADTRSTLSFVLRAGFRVYRSDRQFFIQMVTPLARIYR